MASGRGALPTAESLASVMTTVSTRLAALERRQPGVHAPALVIVGHQASPEQETAIAQAKAEGRHLLVVRVLRAPEKAGGLQ